MPIIALIKFHFQSGPPNQNDSVIHNSSQIPQNELLHTPLFIARFITFNIAMPLSGRSITY